jgi:hypothetical protein
MSQFGDLASWLCRALPRSKVVSVDIVVGGISSCHTSPGHWDLTATDYSTGKTNNQDSGLLFVLFRNAPVFYWVLLYSLFMYDIERVIYSI